MSTGTSSSIGASVRQRRGVAPATVVHYVDASLFGGVEQVAMTLLCGLDRSRWRPLLYAHESPGIAKLLTGVAKAGIEYRLVPAPRNVCDVRALRTFAAQLARDNVEIFHAHLNSPLGCRHGILAARLARLRVVGTAHLCGTLEGVRWAGVKQGLQALAIERYLAVSDGVARHLRADLGVDPAKISIVRNGIQISYPEGAGAALPEPLLAEKAAPIVLTVARLHQQKGIDFLLEAASRVPKALFVLAGDGPESQRLRLKAAALGIDHRVRFLGHVDDVTPLLEACDLFVLPSLYEGLPLSVLEAMAAGKPVVATAISGTDEIITDASTGRLVPPGDADALSAAITALLDDRAEASRLAERGRGRVRERFSAESMVHSVQRVYDDLLSSDAGSADVDRRSSASRAETHG
jgi:glycosyltransferase involved in cell wall biosynthesis